MTLAYLTRKRWEAEIQAVALAKALGGGASEGYQEVPVSNLLSTMGVAIE